MLDEDLTIDNLFQRLREFHSLSDLVEYEWEIEARELEVKPALQFMYDITYQTYETTQKVPNVYSILDSYLNEVGKDE